MKYCFGCIWDSPMGRVASWNMSPERLHGLGLETKNIQEKDKEPDGWRLGRRGGSGGPLSPLPLCRAGIHARHENMTLAPSGVDKETTPNSSSTQVKVNGQRMETGEMEHHMMP